MHARRGREGDAYEADTWSDMANQQGDFRPGEMEEGDCFALHDKNCIAEDWTAASRKVFVMRVDETPRHVSASTTWRDSCAHRRVSTDFVEDGKQLFSSGDNSFTSEWSSDVGASYYCTPKVLKLLQQCTDDAGADTEEASDIEESGALHSGLAVAAAPAAAANVADAKQVNQTVYKLDNATGTLISLMVYSIRSSPIYACVFIIQMRGVWMCPLSSHENRCVLLKLSKTDVSPWN